MTDSEYERLKNTIGDPTKLFDPFGTEQIRLKQVFKNIQDSTNQKYKNAGIEPPKSAREKLIEFNLKKKNGSREEIERAIDRQVEKGILGTDFLL
jgi:hypothetical protein